jgi:hypothetical protein
MSPRIFPHPPAGYERVATIARASPEAGAAQPKSVPVRFDDRINPRWLRIPGAIKYSGISRSRLFRLIRDGEIASACLQEHPKSKRGVRLVDRLSLDLLLERLCQPVEQRLVEEARNLEEQQQALAEKQAQIEGQLATVRERKRGGSL